MTAQLKIIGNNVVEYTMKDKKWRLTKPSVGMAIEEAGCCTTINSTITLSKFKVSYYHFISMAFQARKKFMMDVSFKRKIMPRSGQASGSTRISTH